MMSHTRTCAMAARAHVEQDKHRGKMDNMNKSGRDSDREMKWNGSMATTKYNKPMGGARGSAKTQDVIQRMGEQFTGAGASQRQHRLGHTTRHPPSAHPQTKKSQPQLHCSLLPPLFVASSSTRTTRTIITSHRRNQAT